MLESFPESPVSIRIHCPQCGGNIDFSEDRQVVRCLYCGSSLLIGGREGMMRYLLPAQITEIQEVQRNVLNYLQSEGSPSGHLGEAFLFYAPYWRLQGNVYRWVFGQKPMKGESPANGFSPPMEKIKILLTRLMDHTIPGYNEVQLGLPDLGVRTQALSLQPLNQEHLSKRLKFLPLEIPLDKVKRAAAQYANIFFEAEDIQAEIIRQQVIGEKFSIIYFPIWFSKINTGSCPEAILLDGLGKKVLLRSKEGERIMAKLEEKEESSVFGFGELRFLPLRCPNCGWPFPFRPFSFLHFCQICRHLWGERRGEWAQVEYKVLAPPSGSFEKDFFWVPFWRWQVSIIINMERLETMRDFYRLAPPLRVIDQQKEKRRPIYFYIPAVKFRDPKLILNIASRLTYFQPQTKGATFPDGYQPVTIGGSLLAEDSRGLGMPILAHMIPSASRQARNYLKICQMELIKPELYYLPFEQVDLFLKEPSLGLAFQYRAIPEGLPIAKKLANI